MQENEIIEILKQQLQGQKNYTFDNSLILYKYKGVDYKIYWDKNWDSRLGYIVNFRCDFIKNFSINRKTQHINAISLTISSLENDNRNVIRKLRILSNRIQEQLDINNFVSKLKKDSSRKIIPFLEKELNTSIKDIDVKFFYNEEWYNYKQSYTKKIIRTFNGLTITVRLKYQNVNYHYSFYSECPSKWNDIELKKIKLKSKDENFSRKQITNIIRYAKLKNIFANG